MLNDETDYASRVRNMTDMRQRVITMSDREYMRKHQLAELNASELLRHAEKKKVDTAQLTHRLDILRAIDAKTKK